MKKSNASISIILAMLMIATPLSVFTGMASASGQQSIVPLAGGNFGGGNGTMGNPYIIEDVWDLQNMSANLSAHYVLGNDIDASDTVNWNSGEGFVPVGADANRFTGSLDGQNHTISGLYINRSSTDYVGLFGFIDSGGTVENLWINSHVTGHRSVGGLIGRMRSGHILNNLHSSGYVVGSENLVGGLVGHSQQTVSNSHSTASVSGNENVGGLIGHLDQATVTNSYSCGNVTGNTSVGGLVGDVYSAGVTSKAINSYSTSSVSGNSSVGGLVGSSEGSITDCYSSGKVIGNTNVGGFVGYNNSGSISGGFWDNETAGQVNGTGTGNVSGVNGRNTTDMMTASTFIGANWDFDGAWWQNDQRTYPYLQWQHPEGLPIMNATDLQSIDHNLDGEFYLANDIDASDTVDWNGGKGFNPIGNNSVKFTGSLNGQDHTITGLFINRTDENYVGLFGYLGSTASISNTGVVDANITGRDYVGGFCGFNNGDISSSYGTGSASGFDAVGGLCGFNSGGSITSSYSTGSAWGTHMYIGGFCGVNLVGGSITNSYSTGNASGTRDYVGGFCGFNSGGIANSYSTGNASVTRDSVGGFCAINSHGSITNSYSTGSASGNNYVGGFCGENYGSIANSYSTGNASGNNTVGGFCGYNGGGSITNSYSTGNASGNNTVGGFCGRNSLGSITSSYSTGNASGTSTYVGGFVGYNYQGSISNSSSTGSASGTNDFVGGFTGVNDGGLITNSSSTGNASGVDSVGGFCGLNEYSGNITNSYSRGNASGTGNFVAGFCGYNNAGNITNSSSTGSASGNSNVAGFCGQNYDGGSITDSSSSGKASGGGIEVAGFCAVNNGGNITNSSSTGNASGHDYVGGFCGYNYDGSITNSYSTGSVSGAGDYVGGFCGRNTNSSSIITNCYSTGSVSGNNSVGGFCGDNADSGNITNSYSTGSVSGNNSVGGFAGNNSGNITGCFWDNQTSGWTTSAGGTGKSTADMMDVFTYIEVSWDFANIWGIKQHYTYPYFRDMDWNEPPHPNDDFYSASEDGVLDVQAPGVLTNDDEWEHEDLTVIYSESTSVLGAIVSVDADGGFNYDPTGAVAVQRLAVGETLTDSFNYTVTDGTSNGTATVHINITGVNDAPTASDYFNSTNEDTILTVAAPGLLANDTDPDTDDTLSVLADTFVTVNGASVTINADGSYVYGPSGSATLQALAVGEFLADTFTYTVRDGNGGTDTATVSINVTGMNDDPVAADDLFSIQEDSGANALDVLANDEDTDTSDINTITNVTPGEHGTVTITGGGTGLTYQPDTDYSGTDTFTYNISDSYGGTDTATVTVIVNGTNDAPAITTTDVLTATQDTLYMVHYEATDPDSDTLTWALSTNAGWLTLTGSTISGTPSNADVGTYWVNVSVSDGDGGLDWHNFTLTVQNVNDPPAITTADVTEATQDVSYSVDYNATDADLDTLMWSLTTNAGWLSTDANGWLNGTPTNADVGAYWVNVSVDDGNGGFDWHNFTLTVQNVNDPPSITTTDVTTATQDTLYMVDYEATDPDGDTVTWSLSTDAGWLTMSGNAISGTPSNADVGTYWVNVSLSDGNGGSDYHNFTLTVQNVNDPPTITTADVLTATQGVLYSLEYNATDHDGDALTWSLSTDAPWLSMTNSTISGTPSNADVGSYWVNVSVSDGNGGLDYHNFTLSVQNVNDPPVIENFTAPEGAVDMDYSLLITAHDPDGDCLTWSVNGPSWLSINASSGLLTGTPDTAGNFPLDVTVSDGNGGADTASFVIHITADSDGDGVNNTDDAYPMDPTRWEPPVEYNNETVYENNTVYVNSTVWTPIEDTYLNDTDNDGMPDSWELLYELNPNSSADASGDLDGDGITNLQEYQGGTSPTHADTSGTSSTSENGEQPASGDILLPALLALIAGLVAGLAIAGLLRKKTGGAGETSESLEESEDSGEESAEEDRDITEDLIKEDDA